MAITTLEPIAAQEPAVRVALLALNNAHAQATSFLTPEKWDTLLTMAFAAVCADKDAAMLIAFDQDADYDNDNFRWFGNRYARFVYVDRIIVSEGSRGKGMADQLYRRLFGMARNAGHEHVVCEVNIVPPNPGSDVFHRKMGFTEVGRAVLEGRNKTVRYLSRNLAE